MATSADDVRPLGRIAGSATPDADQRIGWLLRSWRQRLRPVGNAKAFAQSIAEQGLAADVSRVSRWETGQAPAPLDIVRAYESCLGTPYGGMQSVAVALRRTSGRAVTLGVKFTPQRLQDVLDRACEPDASSGDWLELATLVAAKPDQVVLPTRLWEDLVARLVKDLSASSGHAYLCRSEAASLLGRHPLARRPMVEQLAALQDAAANPDPAIAALTRRRIDSDNGVALGTVTWTANLQRTGREDPILTTLVDEAIFHPDYPTRFYARFTLALSPASDLVAAGAKAASDHSEPSVAVRLAELSSFLDRHSE